MRLRPQAAWGLGEADSLYKEAFVRDALPSALRLRLMVVSEVAWGKWGGGGGGAHEKAGSREQRCSVIDISVARDLVFFLRVRIG